jgi:dTDP-4-amino-4,6-dideoxygalactose transaminase
VSHPAPSILANDFRAQWADTAAAVPGALARVGESGWLILGAEVRAFEAALAQAWGLGHAVGVANGMDAIEIALRAAGMAPGAPVLTTPLSAFATTLAIVRAGGHPVFVDVDATGGLDLDAVEAWLHDHSAAETWMVPVHLYGHCQDLERLAALRDRFGVRIVEDCAQSIGARWHDRPCGTVGLAATTSFYPTKNLGALGDGGALLTDDAELAARCRQWRDYGQSARYHHGVLGLNSRLDELQAAILRSALLPRLPAATARRRLLAARYQAGLQGLPGLTLPPAPASSESVWHLFPVLADGGRDSLTAALQAAGVQTGIHYPVLIPDQKAMTDTAFTMAGDLARARRFAATELSLPIHPYLSDDAADRVIAACREWSGSHAS